MSAEQETSASRGGGGVTRPAGARLAGALTALRDKVNGAGGAGDGEGANGDETAADGPGTGAPRRTTRRFPALTRDTARPEGGGRAASGSAPAPYRQWPLLAVCGGVLLGLLVTCAEFRSGSLIIGLSLLGGAALRWTLPSVGMLAVRSRFTDLVTYALLGVVIMLLAMMSQPDPWISIPFLDDIVHFSVR